MIGAADLATRREPETYGTEKYYPEIGSFVMVNNRTPEIAVTNDTDNISNKDLTELLEPRNLLNIRHLAHLPEMNRRKQKHTNIFEIIVKPLKTIRRSTS